MKFRLLIGYKTSKGTAFIAQSEDGRYHPMWREESLGSYHSLVAAVEDVAGGHVFTPSDGTDMGSLGLSADPSEWDPARELM
jgi:hypothetical protein